MSKLLIILFICTYFAKSYNQCVNDKYYNYYHTLIRNEKDNIRNVFDDILNQYGDAVKILEDMLSKLNESISIAESRLNQAEKYNNDIKDINDDSSTDIQYILRNLKTIEDGLKLINYSKNWQNDLEKVEKNANKIIPLAVGINLTQHEEELGKWNNFLKQLGDRNYSNDLMNIPHSVSEDISLLEKLITGEPNTNCYERFHNDLKQLFGELANLFDFGIFENDMSRIKASISKNKKAADTIVSNTKDILDKEKQLKKTRDITNKTLTLAEEIDTLKEKINELSSHNEQIIDDRLKKLQEEHEADVKKLDEKYNVKEGRTLLNKLKKTRQQIENVDISVVEKDIDNYLRDIDYYTCVLEKCESTRKTTSDCKREK